MIPSAATPIIVYFDSLDDEIDIDCDFQACLRMLKQTKMWTQVASMMPLQMSLKGGGLD
jgi:hypothetical protein